MRRRQAIARVVVVLLYLFRRAPQVSAKWNTNGRGIDAGKHQQLGTVKPPVEATPKPQRQSFLLLSVAGYVVAGILPSSTPLEDDVLAFASFLRIAGDDEELCRESGLASAPPSVQRAAGAAVGVILSRPLRLLAPVAILWAIAALLAGETNWYFRRELGAAWYETGRDDLDRWLCHLDRTLERWRRCVWFAIDDPPKTYMRIRRRLDALLRQGFCLPPHAANGVIGGIAVGLLTA